MTDHAPAPSRELAYPAIPQDVFDGVAATEAVIWIAPAGVPLPGPDGPIGAAWHRCAAADGAALLAALRDGNQAPRTVRIRLLTTPPEPCSPGRDVSAVAEATDTTTGRHMRVVMPLARYRESLGGDGAFEYHLDPWVDDTTRNTIHTSRSLPTAISRWLNI